MKIIKNATMRGLTAIELLIYTSILALITVFAAPMMSSVLLESDLDKAEEITEESIQKARVSARLYGSDVTLRITASGEQARHGITVSIPRAGQDTTLGVLTKEYALPVTVRVVSGDTLVMFNPDGGVNSPTTVMLASVDGASQRRNLVIE
jgi:Tfp pilus assembly protein FimT